VVVRNRNVEGGFFEVAQVTMKTAGAREPRLGASRIASHLQRSHHSITQNSSIVAAWQAMAIVSLLHDLHCLLSHPPAECFKLAPSLQLWRATSPVLTNRCRHARLLVLLTEQAALVEILVARWHIQCWVLVEEVHRLHVDLQDLARHDREVFNSGDVVDSSLNVENEVCVFDILVPICPRSHSGASARLVGVQSSRVQLAVAVLDYVDVMVRELGALVVEAVLI
jgi:hypothetical protein